MPEDYGEAFQFERVPMTEKKISDISGDDIRVAVLGTVVDTSKDRFILDDGEESIEVFLTDDLEPILEGLVRVIGRVRSTEEGVHLEAEAIQKMEGLDVNLYKSVKSMLG